MKKLNQCLHQNSAWITLFSVIILPILTLITTYCTTKEQTILQKEYSPPIFFVEKKDKVDGYKDAIEITNEGGLVPYFQFERVTRIYITMYGKKMDLEISYQDKNRLSNMNSNRKNQNQWYYLSLLNTTDYSEIQSKLNEKIDSIYTGDEQVFLYVDDMYELTYRDYEHNLKKIYYKLDQNGIGQEYDFSLENDLENTVVFGGMMISASENEKELYKKIEYWVLDSILELRWHSRGVVW